MRLLTLIQTAFRRDAGLFVTVSRGGRPPVANTDPSELLEECAEAPVSRVPSGRPYGVRVATTGIALGNPGLVSRFVARRHPAPPSRSRRAEHQEVRA